MNEKKNFRPITDVEIIEEMTENDTVLIERNGEVKRTRGVIGGNSDSGIVWLTRNSLGQFFIKDGDGAVLSTEEFADLFNKNVLRLDMSDEEGSYINTITGYAFTYSGNFVYVGNDTYGGDFD